ncbi:hypothetical protein GCU67_15110 [Modestobacter muralis]|uniref:Uncharacterized protein n=1 Tax=Modestobacter muralis TaxID=1608614 RepID=A0A6P0H9G7_9ACTN|nr:hypothetical protein [Modestobacter muralis]NEK95484.1 hypothetical protein [Modestobacter muralis]NEN52372.1 hypothetical protein [Modestobacter muralis]
MSRSPSENPQHPTPTWPGRALVWPLAMAWLALQALGRAGLWLLATVDAGTSAVARGVGHALRAAVRALGPLGRWLLRALAPPLRGLRRVWAWLNRRVFLAMARGLGRAGRWLVRRSRPLVLVVRRWARQVAVRIRPAVRRLRAATAVVERAAARLGRALARAVAPLRRLVRSAGASIAARVRALGVTGDQPVEPPAAVVPEPAAPRADARR